MASYLSSILGQTGACRLMVKSRDVMSLFFFYKGVVSISTSSSAFKVRIGPSITLLVLSPFGCPEHSTTAMSIFVVSCSASKNGKFISLVTMYLGGKVQGELGVGTRFFHTLKRF